MPATLHTISLLIEQHCRGDDMTVTNLQTLKENIEADSIEVSQQFGSEEVDFVFMKYGATSIDDLDPSDYSSVFSELDALLNN